MEICPKEIYISIWHLPYQIKVHKENIRAKRETSEASSGPCQTFKMTIFARIHKYWLLAFLSKLSYTEIYWEPSWISKMELFAKIVKIFYPLRVHQLLAFNPFLVRCHISIPPENVRKPMVFRYFQGLYKWD